MLTYEVIGPDEDGFYAAGYWRPGRSEFMTLVDGCPSEKAAYQECVRLAKEAEARSAPPALPHHMRAPSRAWYAEAE